MAKRARRGRKFRRYLRGNIDETLDLGTFAAATLVSVTVTDTVQEPAWCSSTKLVTTLRDFTPASNVGPILVGVAHSDYTDPEIEEWVENLASWNEGDKISQERGRRYCRHSGTFEISPTGAIAWTALNDGRPVHTKCGWRLIEGQTLKLWAYNQGSAAISTTTPVVRWNGHANLWPK